MLSQQSSCPSFNNKLSLNYICYQNCSSRVNERSWHKHFNFGTDESYGLLRFAMFRFRDAMSQDGHGQQHDPVDLER